VTDIELVASILAGDKGALKGLFRRYQRTLLRTARAILRDDAEAEDAVQDAYLQAYRALATFRGESKLSTWLVRITVNEALRRRRNAKGMPAEVDMESLASGAPSPESDAANWQLRRRLDERIEGLSEAYRSVFRLRALEELSVEETAAALGIPEATVRTRYFRARGLLREALAQESDQRGSLASSLVITDEDLKRLTALKPHAALLRELERAAVVSPKVATLVDAVTMNSQVLYTDEESGAQRQINVVYPHEAGGCACSVSILAPLGTALIGLRAGQTIEWDFAEGSHRRLRVEKVIHHDCPLNVARGPVAK
jgi:RNA polymerase sigma-70 factor (ECF subfamily)